MDELWKKYRGDFNAMLDQEIEHECRVSQEEIDRHEEWLEAVASWQKAGKPRDSD